MSSSQSLSPSTSKNRNKRRHSQTDYRRRHTSSELMSAHEMGAQSGGWNDWAMFIVSETKRFAVDIQTNETQMTNLRESISDLKVTLRGLELIVTQIASNEQAIQQLTERVYSLETFKTKAIAVSSTVWAALGLAITIMAIFLAQPVDPVPTETSAPT